MKKIRFFKCGSCDEVHEKLIEDNEKTIVCDCKAIATRLLSAPRCFSNTVGKSPAVR